jgi:hypothetical protein
MSDERHIFCLYADDIRHEINGKVSLIGIYQGGMNVVGVMPQVLPRLVISSYVNTPVSRPFSDLSVDVLWNDEVLQKVTPPTESLQEMQSTGLQDSEARLLSMQMVFVMQPFEVKGNGKLRVRAHMDGETLESNALKIQVVDGPPEATL